MRFAQLACCLFLSMFHSMRGVKCVGHRRPGWLFWAPHFSAWAATGAFRIQRSVQRFPPPVEVPFGNSVGCEGGGGGGEMPVTGKQSAK